LLKERKGYAVIHRPLPPLSDWEWRWLDPPEQDPPLRDEWIRQGARSIAMALSSGGVRKTVDRTQKDVDLFNMATERRYVGNPRYSACGDIVGFTLCLLGCRDEGIVNRDDDNLDGKPDAKQGADMMSDWDIRGARGWRSGMNIALLKQGAINAKAWVSARQGVDLSKLGMGDYFLLDEGTMAEHVGQIVSVPVYDPTRKLYRAYAVEGGQVDQFGQCVRLYEVEFSVEGGKAIYYRPETKRKSVLSGWADITRIPYTAPALLPPVCSVVGLPVED